VVGTIGYYVLEDMTLLDALYMTVTTISTVGFGEVHPLIAHGACVYYWPDSVWG
jgi:voltage-gated potassium channel